MHILVETEMVSDRCEDESIKTKILNQTDYIKVQYAMISKLDKYRKEYELEKQLIKNSMAKFAHFLKKHAIAVRGDAYADYLDYLIKREKDQGDVKMAERFVIKCIYALFIILI